MTCLVVRVMLKSKCNIYHSVIILRVPFHWAENVLRVILKDKAISANYSVFGHQQIARLCACLLPNYVLNANEENIHRAG